VTSAAGGNDRLYRGLLRLYPADYRAQFSDQMVQLFTDQKREVGAARAWLRAPIDLITTAVGEHLRRNRTVAHSTTLTPTPAARVLGILGVLGGAVLLAAFAIEIAPDVNVLRLALFNIGAIAVALAALRVQASTSPRLATAATALVVVTNGLYLLTVVAEQAIAELPRLGLIYSVIGGAMWLSDLWFGVVTLRLGVLSRWAALALVVGSAFAFIGMGVFGLTVPGTLLNALIMTGLAAHGLGWVLLGLELALRRRPTPTASA
jgi:hypothetical protein